MLGAEFNPDKPVVSTVHEEEVRECLALSCPGTKCVRLFACNNVYDACLCFACNYEGEGTTVCPHNCMVALFCLYLYVLVYACVFVYQYHVWLLVICVLFRYCVGVFVRVLSFVRV